MTTDEFIITLFCRVDDQIGVQRKHPQSYLYPSEVVTLALLFVLKGASYRAFYRWTQRDLRSLFPHLPDRTRLLRLFRRHASLTDCFLAQPSFFTVMDTYGVELLHPVREKRSRATLGRKGLSNRRWIVGVKLCWLITDAGEVVDWAWETANVHDQVFRSVAEQFAEETIALVDLGFRQANTPHRNLKFCPPGTWNERMVIETVFSLITTVCRLKKIRHRVAAYLTAHFGYAAALFNCLLSLNNGQLSIAPFSL